MSEEILKAILRLFAILLRQDSKIVQHELDYVKSYLQDKIEDGSVEAYYEDFLGKLNLDNDDGQSSIAVSPLDSMDVLRIGYKINETLNQQQKVITIVECLELIQRSPDRQQKEEILATCSEVFNLPREEYQNLKFLIESTAESDFSKEIFQVLEASTEDYDATNTLSEKESCRLVFLIVRSVNMLLMKSFEDDCYEYNNISLSKNKVYAFPPGSVLKDVHNNNWFYSSIYNLFTEKDEVEKIVFEVRNIEYEFPGEKIGLHETSFVASESNLIAIMGGSGSGKTTMLKVLAGLDKPSKGEVVLNSVNIHEDRSHRMVGYVSQEDLLIEELTVFQNLYLNAKLFFGDENAEDLKVRVDKTLQQLGLYEARNLKVGNVLNKVLSGGQRKRLNIGLELIRNPKVFFLDEPLSGLSSKDSTNVLSLLNQLKYKGHLLFIVLHQPSSDIYKQFDKVILVDKGGYCIYYGNPIEALSYFKDTGNKINKGLTHCSECGSVRPEDVFDIVEEKRLDEFGAETFTRKVSPKEWYDKFREHQEIKTDSSKFHEGVGEMTDNTVLPSKFSQFKTYVTRDFLSKISNLQYVALAILEPVLLALILSLLVKQSEGGISNEYFYYYNDNIPAYFFISIVVIIFIGLSMSAEEIYHDRKILARERFLNLSRWSYLKSKAFLTSIISALQVLLFTFVGNSILGIESGNLTFYFMLFTVAVNANLIGLIISSTFDSAVVIYILIPLLIIPQLILGGALFHYEKLNLSESSKGYAPYVSWLVPARWAYEGIAVQSFTHNDYEKVVYENEKYLSYYSYKNGPYISKLYEIIDEHMMALMHDEKMPNFKNALQLLYHELEKEIMYLDDTTLVLPPMDSITKIESQELKKILEALSEYYVSQYRKAQSLKDQVIISYNEVHDKDLNSLKMHFHNKRLESLLKKQYSNYSILLGKDQLMRLYEPIYDENSMSTEGYVPRYSFFSPKRNLFSMKVNTFWYNVFVLWISNVILFVLLYFDVFRLLLKKFKS